MKKFIIPVALCAMLMSGPAMAFMTLKSCSMVNTMNGVRWLGVYCDAQRNCVQQLFNEYCPYMI
jgi:hypothetical protein